MSGRSPRGPHGAGSRRRIGRCSAPLVAGCLAVLGAATLAHEAARPLDAALADETVRAALEQLDAATERTAALLRDLGAIVSPSGHEHERAARVAREMERIGLREVRIDTAPNAIGLIPGRSGRAVVFVSTLDDLATVADHQRAAASPPRVEGDRVVGPGTNTSSTTAALLAAAEALVAAGVAPAHDLVFAAVAQEETGMGGMKALYRGYGDRAEAFVDVLGDGRRISYGAIVIHWWKVVAQGPPGHTLRGGLPNVNLGIARAVDRILNLPHPERERASQTVINVAMLQSGQVFNHKPAEGWFSLDVRSLDAAVVDAIEHDVREILAEVGVATGTRLTMEPHQMVPGGQLPGARESTLVQTALAVARHLGLTPELNHAGSSNMNVAIGGGTPAIGLGGERGDRRGFPDEWASVPNMMRTARHVLLLAATLGAAPAADAR